MSRTSIEGPSGARRVSLNGPTMGTRWTAVWFDDGGPDPMAIGQALVRAVGAVDDQMSTWKPDSDLMQLNRAPVGDWMEVPPTLVSVLAAALQIRDASDGAFDIGVGRLVAEWGFGAHAGQVEGLAGARASLDIDALEIDRRGSRVRKRAPMALDLSGIAKGFGVDELARVLDAAGIGAFLVGIDGEMRARGKKPGETPWSVAVERPELERRRIHGVIDLEDCAVATSGDYRHVRDGDGGRISHTIDPRTGRPVANGVASVTVLAPTAMVADATATALMVLGPDDGLSFADRFGAECLFVLRRDDGSFAERASGRFAEAAGDPVENQAFTVSADAVGQKGSDERAAQSPATA
ncbi:FAD:protein FMN transferase [Mongoliimonas terrestris]|uniref:FAD:protein FMN transferase n=1 Tax=Mongoliimonas terrestris TaxID=1709001 RepID=UPI000AA413A0|nr:FAD:protein FMN transferase [Mongoliimonas terrestris]